MRLFLLFFLIFFLVASVPISKATTKSSLVSAQEEKRPRIPLQIGAHHLNVEVAADETSRAQGLMFRTMLKPDQGMLFVFPKPQRVTFWMKDTLLLLTIAYIKNDGRIFEIHDLKSMSINSIPSSSETIVYALEVTRGWFAEHGVLAGDRIEGLPSLSIAQ
ncbi:MAG: DUF192 domain-containing protein [Chthoniobacterales bacterium]